MTDASGSERSAQTRTWIRRYPPLVAFIIALLIMIIVMPSALNLPQANPTTVLEYAPIPPEKHDNPPPQSGSLSNLGLGTSDTLTTEAGGLNPKQLLTKLGNSSNPIVKHCVQTPAGARQTEDINSPPCVPYFNGDNGGSTFRGVTKDEVKVIVDDDGDVMSTGGDKGTETSPSGGSICDIDSKPNDPNNANCEDGEGRGDYTDVTVIRALERYFNERYQTYNRHVHLYVYFSAGASTPAGRRSEVQDMYERVGPFAVVDMTTNLTGNGNSMIEAAVKRQMNVYGSYAMSPNSLFKSYAPYLWSFWPDQEHQAEMFKDYFCKRIAPFKVDHSGNSADMGTQRKYGFLYTTDPGAPGLTQFAHLAKSELMQGCPNVSAPLNFSKNDYTYSRNGYATDTNPTAASEAQTNVQKMQIDGVTTILWLSGYETQTSQAADAAGWHPEWVLAGDLLNDQTEEAQAQQGNAWKYARIMTNQLRDDKAADSPCRDAIKEGDPYATNYDQNRACGIYRPFFMLFRGIQVAGPYLTPQSVDQGNHSLQAVQSTDPYLASCYFDPGDYSCVKDAEEEWFDPSAPDPNGGAANGNTGMGCWRESEGGKRYIAGKWTQTDPAFVASSNTPCNTTTDGQENINPYGPAG
jgi:hypothetical protein